MSHNIFKLKHYKNVIKNSHSIEKKILLATIKEDLYLYKHLSDRNMIDTFYEKCCEYISKELKELIKTSNFRDDISDEAYINLFEELKIKLINKAIRKLKPHFYNL